MPLVLHQMFVSENHFGIGRLMLHCLRTKKATIQHTPAFSLDVLSYCVPDSLSQQIICSIVFIKLPCPYTPSPSPIPPFPPIPVPPLQTHNRLMWTFCCRQPPPPPLPQATGTPPKARVGEVGGCTSTSVGLCSVLDAPREPSAGVDK